jgi:chromosome segregation ATPase
VKTEELASQDTIDAGVAELRQRFPRTQDLYREVCVLLFFRHGITPTVNKLYQLVRKGSMSAPTEALNKFWSTLRERSRVTVEHVDLPDELQAAAGEMVAALWKSAQTRSWDGLAELRAESAAAAETARGAEAQARTAHTATLQELEQARARVHTNEELIDQLRQELAAAGATNTSMEARLDDLRRQIADVLLRADQQNATHLAEREKLAERTRLAEQRFADMEKRALLDMDRERTVSAKLRKTLEGERALHAKSLDRVHAEQAAAQEAIGQLHGQIHAAQTIVTALTQERERERAEAQAMRIQLDTAIRTAALESARGEQLNKEIERSRERVDQHRKPATGTSKAKDNIRPGRKPRLPRGGGSGNKQ